MRSLDGVNAVVASGPNERLLAQTPVHLRRPSSCRHRPVLERRSLWRPEAGNRRVSARRAAKKRQRQRYTGKGRRSRGMELGKRRMLRRNRCMSRRSRCVGVEAQRARVEVQQVRVRVEAQHLRACWCTVRACVLSRNGCMMNEALQVRVSCCLLPFCVNSAAVDLPWACLSMRSPDTCILCLPSARAENCEPHMLFSLTSNPQNDPISSACQIVRTYY